VRDPNALPRLGHSPFAALNRLVTEVSGRQQAVPVVTDRVAPVADACPAGFRMHLV